MDDFTTRLDRTFLRLTDEGWKCGYQDDFYYFRTGSSIAFIDKDGEVTSVDNVVRMYVHRIFYPEAYGLTQYHYDHNHTEG